MATRGFLVRTEKAPNPLISTLLPSANAVVSLLKTTSTILSTSFGNVSVTVRVIPANVEKKKIDLIRDAFSGNPIFSYATTVEGVMTNPISYAVFKPEVCQIWNDNLHDPHGLVSDLYENIAREIIGEDGGIFFSTDSKAPMACG